MSAPFEKFEIKSDLGWSVFHILVKPRANSGSMSEDQRKFIEDAIREKLEREQ